MFFEKRKKEKEKVVPNGKNIPIDVFMKLHHQLALSVPLVERIGKLGFSYSPPGMGKDITYDMSIPNGLLSIGRYWWYGDHFGEIAFMTPYGILYFKEEDELTDEILSAFGAGNTIINV